MPFYLYKLEDLQTKRNIVYFNKRAEKVNKYIHSEADDNRLHQADTRWSKGYPTTTATSPRMGWVFAESIPSPRRVAPDPNRGIVERDPVDPTELLRCGDVHPHPGPDQVSRRWPYATQRRGQRQQSTHSNTAPTPPTTTTISVLQANIGAWNANQAELEDLLIRTSKI